MGIVDGGRGRGRELFDGGRSLIHWKRETDKKIEERTSRRTSRRSRINKNEACTSSKTGRSKSRTRDSYRLSVERSGEDRAENIGIKEGEEQQSGIGRITKQEKMKGRVIERMKRRRDEVKLEKATRRISQRGTASLTAPLTAAVNPNYTTSSITRLDKADTRRHDYYTRLLTHGRLTHGLIAWHCVSVCILNLPDVYISQ